MSFEKKRFGVSIFILGVIILGASFLLLHGAVAAPSGATTTPQAPQTAPEDSAGNANAYAGNVTQINLIGFTKTQAWQGFYGNVTGTIQLADASDNVFYNWSLANPEGEVFASANSSVTWGSIQCLNFTANGTEGGTGPTETAGGTSQGGVNLTGLEARYGIADDDVDGINETFAFSVASDGHDQFFVGALEFSTGECLHAKPYTSSGASASDTYEEALLYEPATGSVVFASLLEETAVSGFDSGDHDFEMLVLEDGHGTDTAATTYYFWVELE